MKEQARRFWDLEDDLKQFVDGRRGWTMTEETTTRDGVATGRTTYIAKRTLDYPGSSAAMIWFEAHASTSSFTWRLFEAHVSLPFSGGPEESYSPLGSVAKAKFEALTEWVVDKERVLVVPLRIAEAKTYEQAEEVCRSLGSKCLWTLSYVLDLDFSDATSAQLIRQIIRKSAPKLAKEAHRV